MPTFFPLIFGFIYLLPGLSQGLWGLGTTPKEEWYQKEKNQKIVLAGLLNKDGSFEVTAVRHAKEKTSIMYLVESKSHQLDISPNLRAYPIKKATSIKMQKSFRMDGVSQSLVLLTNGVEYLIIGDNSKSRKLKGGYTIYFHRPNLKSLDYRVMVIRDQVQLIQPKKPVTLILGEGSDQAEWNLIMYQFRVFEIIKLQKNSELENSGKKEINPSGNRWANESPVFDYDYLLLRKK